MDALSKGGRMVDTEELLVERGGEYGEAWKLAGQVMTLPEVWNSTLFKHSLYAHNWVLILSKLFRALQTPHKADHWMDIAGYATLVVKDIENGSHGSETM